MAMLASGYYWAQYKGSQEWEVISIDASAPTLAVWYSRFGSDELYDLGDFAVIDPTPIVREGQEK